MFQKARLKLTAWYLLIIMSVSLLFSLIIFTGINNEFTRFEHLQELRIQRQETDFFMPPIPRRLAYFDPAVLNEARERIILVLVLINSGIFVISGAAAYFLSGRTLKPIKDMVDEQNRFIADASHELRTPLTAIKTAIEVSLRNKNIDLTQAKETMREGLNEVNDLQSLTDNLLLLTQYQKNNGNMTFEKVKFADILKDINRKLAPQIKRKNIKITLNSSDQTIYGNKASIIELFIILFDNAIKYSSAKSTIFVSIHKKNDEVIVKVKDEGVGISQNDLPFIFDRFYRADQSRSKNDASGFGLGLSIAKKIVVMHNGRITAESKKGEGATFIVRFPVQKTI